MDETTYPIRVTQRVAFFLSGTQAWADRRDDTSHPDSGEEACRNLMRKLDAAPRTRKDKSVTLRLEVDELDALESYVGAMSAGAADNTWDPDGVADLLAARGALRQIQKTGVVG